MGKNKTVKGRYRIRNDGEDPKGRDRMTEIGRNGFRIENKIK